jgi:starch phosphorylase
MSLPKVAYFSMEMAIDASLHTYAGGLGFLAGSHMLTAGYLDLPMVGITVLWTHGYGKQHITPKNEVEIVYQAHDYPFLTDTGVVVEITLFGEPVKVKAYRLEPETFGTVPIYLLTTDIPDNKPEHRQVSHVLYDADQRTRICQEILLGQGGLRVLEALHEKPDVLHINEGHALPVLFDMLDRLGGNLEELRKRAVFTTHTPVAAGNESHPAHLLHEAGFFAKTRLEEAIHLGGHDFSLTVAALRMCRLANGVSQLHGQVANSMWQWVDRRCPIVAITNSVNLHYWQDPRVRQCGDGVCVVDIKKQLKEELFDYIAQETGTVLKPDVLTLVWARRFTEYKRANLIFRDWKRIKTLLETHRIQLIFAGKFHPNDTRGRETFNQIIGYSRQLPNLVILPNYNLDLSGRLKRGADVWLNTPIRPLEASGTSGMSANMNGALHVSTFDGWAVEGTFDGINGFLINEAGKYDHLSPEDRDQQDYDAMMDIIENKLIPLYYTQKSRWSQLVWHAIRTAESYFHSERMLIEYYNRLYKPIYL